MAELLAALHTGVGLDAQVGGLVVLERAHVVITFVTELTPEPELARVLLLVDVVAAHGGVNLAAEIADKSAPLGSPRQNELVLVEQLVLHDFNLRGC